MVNKSDAAKQAKRVKKARKDKERQAKARQLRAQQAEAAAAAEAEEDAAAEDGAAPKPGPKERLESKHGWVRSGSKAAGPASSAVHRPQGR